MTDSDRELLIRIDTKLTVVCGENGDGGVLARHDARIRALEDTNNREDGKQSVTSRVAIFTGITGFLTAIGHWAWAALHGGR
jgi:hypothetical protein